MKIALLADAGSVHTQRWAAALTDRGHDVTVLSLRPADLGSVPVVDLSPPTHLGKLGYLAVIGTARARLDEITPDLVHAHYATSYGLLGAVSRHRPLMISAWGADVFDFPRRSVVHDRLLRYNLRRADIIASTSHVMKAEVMRYTDKDVEITPFGVDAAVFSPRAAHESDGAGGLTIGLIKGLEEKYGVGVLVRAFELLAQRYPEIRLLIVGGGSQRQLIQSMVDRSRVGSRVRLLPPVPHSEVPGLLRSMDIFAVPSVADSESFGVAAIEASACALPVVASRIGGLPEVVIDGETGLLVPPGDPEALAGALARLIDSPELRRRLGTNGRAFVGSAYSWRQSVDTMERLYGAACAHPVASAHAATRGVDRELPPPKLVIVTSRAPYGLQERFVVREAEALARLGLESVLVPVRPAPRASRRSSVLATLPVGLASMRSLAAVLRLATSRPAELRRLLALVSTDRRPHVMVKNLLTIPLAVRLAELLSQLDVAHVHGAWASTPATVAMVASEISHVPWSFTAHRWDITEANLVRAKLASARFVRAISVRGRSELAAAGGHRPTCEKIVSLHVGVPVPADEGPGMVRDRERPYAVVSVGNLVEKKGQAYLVQASGLLRDRGIAHTVRVVGDGPERMRLRRLIEQLDLRLTVELVGECSGSQVDALLAGETDVFVQPSIVSQSGEYEGIPVALMEAMAAGRPVIATRSGSIEELVTSDCGLLVPPRDPVALADGIELLARDRALAAKLGSAGRARVAEHFNEATSSAELARLIRQTGTVGCACLTQTVGV